MSLPQLPNSLFGAAFLAESDEILGESLSSSVAGGTWTDISRTLNYPHFEIRVTDQSAANQTINAMVNLTK